MRKKKRKNFKQFKFKVKPKFIWIGISLVITIGLLAVLCRVIYIAEIFKIKQNDIRSNIVLSQRLKKKIIGQSLFDLDVRPISLQLSLEHPEYKDVHVFKRFPSRLIIEADARKPFAQIKARRFYSIDKEAIILDKGSAAPLSGLVPIEISDYNRFFKVGYNIKDKRLKYAFDLIAALSSESFFDKSKIKLINSTSPQAIYFIVEEGAFTGKEKEFSMRSIKVIIGKNDFMQRIKVLRNLIEQELKDKISLVKYIDLRYKKVYVGFRR